MRERAREQRFERTRRLLLATIELATVRGLGDGFARGMNRDIFGLDPVLRDREVCS